MPLASDPAFFWIVLVIQIVGLLSMVVGRVPQSTFVHRLCRTCFLGCLIAVGLAAIGTSIGCHSSCWASCATMFSIMAVGATADLGGAASAHGF